jgi:hypothetical protein
MLLLFAADLNASAVKLLVEEDVSLAKCLAAKGPLDEALRLVERFTSSCIDEQEWGDPTRVYGDCPLNAPGFDTNTYAVFQGNILQQEIYNGAFLLAADIPVAPQPTAAVLLFNLGLIYHRIANIHGRSQDFSTAADCYIRSYTMLRESAQSGGKKHIDGSSSALIVLKAALCYNLSHIFLVSFCDNRTAEFFLIALQKLVPRMVGLVSEYDYLFFQRLLQFLTDTTATRNASYASAA